MMVVTPMFDEQSDNFGDTATHLATMNTTETMLAGNERYDVELISKVTIILPILVLSLFGNGLIIVIIAKQTQMRTVINGFVSALSASDLLVTLFCMPLVLTSLVLYRWPFGETVCVLHHYITSVTAVYTSMSMMFIAVDRYVAVVRPSHWRIGGKLSAMLIGTAWCLSLIISIPWDIRKGQFVITSDEQQMVCRNFLPSPSRTEVYRYILSSGVGHIFPLTVTLYCFVIICSKVYSVHVKVRPSVVPLSHLLFQSEMRTATTVIIIITIYLLCWLPYIVLLILSCIRCLRPSEIFFDLAIWLTWANKAINPTIYALRNKTVSGYLKGCGCWWRRQKVRRPDVYKWKEFDRSRNASIVSESGLGSCSPAMFYARSSVDSDIALTSASGDISLYSEKQMQRIMAGDTQTLGRMN